jgi:hypothetical protein
MFARGVSVETVAVHAAAPPKPPEGAPCNGCGWCCATEPCPVARLLLRRATGSCSALEWTEEARRYRCGLVVSPAAYLRWLPRRWEGAAGRWFASRIAAGSGCDFGATEIGGT